MICARDTCVVLVSVRSSVEEECGRMRIQERCFLLALAVLCLLGGVAYSFTFAQAETWVTTMPGECLHRKVRTCFSL